MWEICISCVKIFFNFLKQQKKNLWKKPRKKNIFQCWTFFMKFFIYKLVNLSFLNVNKKTNLHKKSTLKLKIYFMWGWSWVFFKFFSFFVLKTQSKLLSTSLIMCLLYFSTSSCALHEIFPKKRVKKRKEIFKVRLVKVVNKKRFTFIKNYTFFLILKQIKFGQYITLILFHFGPKLILM